MRKHKLINLRQLPRLVVHSCELLPTGEAAVARFMSSEPGRRVLVSRCDYVNNVVYLLADAANAEKRPPLAAVEWYFLENDWERLSRLLGPNAVVIQLQYSEFAVREIGRCFVDMWNYAEHVQLATA